MERPGDIENDILAWLILGYLCSHPDAKDTAVGIGRWWLRLEGIQVDVLRIRDALRYLEQRGWLTTRGDGPALKVYGLNRNRQQILQDFFQMHSLLNPSFQGQDVASALARESFPST
jgi:hypothetical protein